MYEISRVRCSHAQRIFQQQYGRKDSPANGTSATVPELMSGS
jgi:hypothetical protein